MLIDTLQSLFWDVDFLTLDVKKHLIFIIERVLEFGDREAVQWLFKNYTPAEISGVVLHSRRLSPKSKNFWALKFNLWNNIQPSDNKQKTIWRY